MPRPGELVAGAVGKTLDIPRTVSALPIEIRGRCPSSTRTEHNALAIRCPHWLHIRDRIEGEATQGVASPVVDPHIEPTSSDRVNREPASIWREAWVAPSCDTGTHRRSCSIATHPHDRDVARNVTSRLKNNRAVVRHSVLGATSSGASSHAFQHRHRLADKLQPIDIKRHREQCPSVHIDKMSAWQVPAVVAAALD